MRISIILLFSLYAHCIQAQNVVYFENNPEWRQSSTCAIPYPCIENQEFVYYLNGDSTVGDINYKKLYKRGERWRYPLDQIPDPSTCSGYWTFNEFYILVRQEGQKIYIRNVEEELLLYDFELAIGDTLPFTANQWNEAIVVESIDSLLVGEAYRKVFNLSPQSSPQLIEGIGHESGFLEPFPPYFDCGYSLFCFALNDTSYYPNFNAFCELNVDIVENERTETISYYPNPVSNILYVKTGEAIDHVYYTSLLGQRNEVKFRWKGNALLSIDLTFLNSGIYSIELLSKGSLVSSLKILKE